MWLLAQMQEQQQSQTGGWSLMGTLVALGIAVMVIKVIAHAARPKNRNGMKLILLACMLTCLGCDVTPHQAERRFRQTPQPKQATGSEIGQMGPEYGAGPSKIFIKGQTPHTPPETEYILGPYDLKFNPDTGPITIAD
jgi:hypothetical protein